MYYIILYYVIKQAAADVRPDEADLGGGGARAQVPITIIVMIINVILVVVITISGKK